MPLLHVEDRSPFVAENLTIKQASSRKAGDLSEVDLQAAHSSPRRLESLGLSINDTFIDNAEAPRIGTGAVDSSESEKTTRVLAFVEASSLTGPAKNLIAFARRAAVRRGSQLGAIISVVTFHRGKSLASNSFILACRKAGLDVHVIREGFPFDLSIIPAIRRLVAALKPEIVQTHSVKSHFLVKLSAVYRERCWIAFHHGYTWTDLKMRLYNQLDRISLPTASRVVTVCRPFASALEDMGVRAESIAIQHNSATTFIRPPNDEILELRQTLRIVPGTKVLLNVARLSREKGHLDLIDAIARLKIQKNELKFHLVIVGDGPERKRLKDKIRASGVADRVTFAGYQADVTPYYAMADLMVLPSHTEGSPNTLLEALAAGLPIVATAVGGVPEIVTTEKEALLVGKQNPIALAYAIERVLRDKDLQRNMSCAAQRAASAYSPEAYCDSVLSMYTNCLAEESEHSKLPRWRFSSVR